MSNDVAYIQSHPQATPIILRARILGVDGDPVAQADISEIYVSVFKPYSATPTVATSGPTSITVSSVIFDTLQSWDRDATGYNFSYTLGAAALPDIAVYQIEVKFTDTGANSFYATWRVNTRSLLTV